MLRSLPGVVRDAKYTDPQSEMRPMFFLPLTQSTQFQEPAMQMVDTRSHFIPGAVLLFHGDLGLLEPHAPVRRSPSSRRSPVPTSPSR
jgi:hypothetical protein